MSGRITNLKILAGSIIPVNKLIPYYVWFFYGFAIVSVVMGIVNFGMVAVTMLTVKGIDIPSWSIILVVLVMVISCTAMGYFFDKNKIWNRVTSYQNQNTNPEIAQMFGSLKDLSNDIKSIKIKLGIEE
jgi:cell division protein FtsW (lipid II flippase)